LERLTKARSSPFNPFPPKNLRFEFDFAGFADDQANIFVSTGEMKRILNGLKSLGLRWSDLRGREVLKGASHPAGTNMLDITLLGSDATGEAHIRIAEMCDLLDRLDSTMPTPRILWQFRTFRSDNGCEIRGYENHTVPAE
jgi:hypothetical protein